MEQGTGSGSSVIPLPRQQYGARNSKLRRLGYPSYVAYLNSPHWKRMRQRYRASDLPQVCVCGEEEVHLHHTTYERVGDEDLGDLTPLCARCHNLVHVLERRGEIGIDLDGLTSEERAVAYRAQLADAAKRRVGEDEMVAYEAAQRVFSLPLHDRLRLLQRLAFHAGVDINSDMRLIERTLAKIHRRIVNPDFRV
jgi:hypothetical protein